jgi:hypothetical protein
MMQLREGQRIQLVHSVYEYTRMPNLYGLGSIELSLN